jgi:hypothetical protein
MQTHKEQGDLISLHVFFHKEESRLKDELLNNYPYHKQYHYVKINSCVSFNISTDTHIAFK